MDSGSVSESPARRPAGVTDPLAATGASESRVRVSLGSQLAAGPQGPVSRRGYRHVTGIVPHKIPGPADACNIQAPTGTAGYNLWKTRHLQKGVQGGRRYTEEVLIPRPLAKLIRFIKCPWHELCFSAPTHPPRENKVGNRGTIHWLASALRTTAGILYSFSSTRSAVSKDQTKSAIYVHMSKVAVQAHLVWERISMVAIEKGQVFFWEESARPPVVGAHPGGPGCPGESPGRGWLCVRMVVSSVENH